MRYTNYFSIVVKENGQPQLSSEQFRLMMNIIFLEGVIHGLNKSKEANNGTDQFYKYDVIIFKNEKRLTDLTGNVEPNELLLQMLKKE